MNTFVVVGYSGFFTSSFIYPNQPNNWLVYASIFTAFFGIYGLMTVGFIMVNQFSGNKTRGSVMGVTCLGGAIGILIVSKLGGLAFDKNIYSPFIGVGILSLIMLILVIIPSLRRKLNNDE